MNLHRLLSDNKRTALMRKNIFFSFLIKGWSGLVTFLLVRLTLECLGDYKNGIWLTISSMLVWIDNFDIGLGNGLRNELASNLAKGDVGKAREAVTSTVVMLFCIIIPVVTVLIFILSNIDLNSFLNIDRSIVDNIFEVTAISLLFVASTFIFKFIGNVYLGLQLPAVNNLLVTLGHTLQLIGVGILLLFQQDSLLLVAIIYTGSSLFVYLMAYPVTFFKLFPHLRPSWNYFKIDTAKALLSIGIIFFLLQISSLLVNMSTNFLISHFLSPEKVVPYNISWRYFTIAQLVFAVICSPYWTATTDAYARHDYTWIRQSQKRMDIMLFAIFLLILLMTPLSKWVYPLLTGNIVKIPMSITITMALYMVILLYCMAYCYFLNGMGKLRLQLFLTVGEAILYLPIAFFTIRYTHNVVYLLSVMCLINLPSLICNKLQYEKVIRGKATGIWSK